MFEDILEPTKRDFEEKLKELKDALHESRDWMLDKQNENDTLKKLYNETYNDASRFTKHITDLYKIIKENDLEDYFKNLEESE